MDTWTVVVEIDGKEVWSGTYGDLAAAQMARERWQAHYHYHVHAALMNVVVVIEQS